MVEIDQINTVVLGRLIYDAMRHAGSVTTAHLRKFFNRWLVDEEKIQEVKKEIENIPEGIESSPVNIAKYLDDNQRIQAILCQLSSIKQFTGSWYALHKATSKNT